MTELERELLKEQYDTLSDQWADLKVKVITAEYAEKDCESEKGQLAELTTRLDMLQLILYPPKKGSTKMTIDNFKAKMTAANLTQEDNIYCFTLAQEDVPEMAADDLFLSAIGDYAEDISFVDLAKSKRDYFLNVTLDPESGKVQDANVTCFVSNDEHGIYDFAELPVAYPSNYKFKAPA